MEKLVQIVYFENISQTLYWICFALLIVVIPVGFVRIFFQKKLTKKY